MATPSTLRTYRVGGQLDPAWVASSVPWTHVRATAALSRPDDGAPAVDPTNGAHEHPLVTVRTLTAAEADGQWATTELKPTAATDPDLALQPTGMLWTITVEIRRGATWHEVITYEVAPSGDRDYDGQGELITVAGDDCININDLIPTPDTTPISDAFADRVIDAIEEHPEAVAADLTVTTDATTVTVVSSTGTDGTIPAATSSAAGAMTAADKAKLDGIESSFALEGQALSARVIMPEAGDYGLVRTGDDYMLLAPMAQGFRWGIQLWRPPFQPNGISDVNQLGPSYAMLGGATVSTDDGTFSGGTTAWTDAGLFTNASAYGGEYRWTATSGYATWDSPTATAVGLRHLRSVNAGYGKVSINGDATLANEIPTAQQEVTAGRLASTALVANGGTLNPTDRVINFYYPDTQWDEVTMLAFGLPSQAHTVRIDWTGYKQAASSDTRVYLTGFVSGPDQALSAELIPAKQIHTDSSAWEYANEFKPTAGSTYHFLGNIHGYETMTSLTFMVDGYPADPADGARVWGTRSVTAVRVTTAQHPESVTTTNQVTTTYHLNRSGLRVTTATSWLEGGSVKSAYAAMHPLVERFDRGHVAGYHPSFSLDQSDNVKHGVVRSPVAIMWSRGDNLASLVILNNPEVATNAWAKSTPVFTAIEDRSGGVLNKVYMTRVGGNGGAGVETVTSSTTWLFDATHRAVWIDDPEGAFAQE